MFSMIGGDGREYGPITADQLREWILDHRANGQTMVRAEGAADWTPLGSLAEFRDALVESARIHGEVPPLEPAEAPEQLASAVPAPAASGVGELRVLDCLGRAWQVLHRHFLLIVGASTLVWSLLTLPQLLPGATGCFGFMVSLAMGGPLFGGLSVLLVRVIRGEATGVNDVFSCFDSRFVACALVYLITGVLEELGLALCLLPGVFLTTVWAFSLPLAADRGLRFSEAVEASWRMVIPRFFKMLALLALALLPLVVFSIYTLVRMFGELQEVLGPPGTWDFLALREKFPELAQQGARLGLQRELVLLLNLPFAWTALMMAYEDLFGTRRAPGA